MGARIVVVCGTSDMVVPGHWLFDSRCGWFSWLLGARCRSLGAGRGLPLTVCFACGCQLGSCHLLGGQVCLWWGLCDMEGALNVVDAGDVGL